GQVTRAEAERGVDVVQRGRERLARQGVHEVEVYALEVVRGDGDGALGFVTIVDAPECLEAGVVEALDADRQAIGAGGTEVAETHGLEGAGDGFEGDLSI